MATLSARATAPGRCLLLTALTVVAFAAVASSESSSDSPRNSTSSVGAAPATAASEVAPPGDGSPPPAYSGASDSAASGSAAVGVATPAPPAYSGVAASAPPAYSGVSDSAASASSAFGAAAPAPPPAYASPRALSGRSISGAAAPANSASAGQFHVQTDEGPERYFRYQTQSGQYRKEKRLQDGSVVGSYGWIGADGVLRLRDYVADNAGYRVVRTKSVFVGRDEPIGSALAKSKSAPSQGGSGFRAPVATAPPPPQQQQQLEQQEPVRRPALGYSAPAFSFSPPASVVYPGYQQSVASNALQAGYSGLPSDYQYQTAPPPAGYYQNSVGQPQYQQYQQYQTPPLYDGISATHNGFRYFLPRHYHEEETQPGDRRAGSFGYVDPFGIRRVIYYNTSPGSGFVHRKNNRYVGFDAAPYDPRF